MLLFNKIPMKDAASVSFNNNDEVWTAKIDGAHAIGVLKAGKEPQLFSHRISKRTKDNILYTPKLPHLPKKSKITAQLRFETYAIDKNGKAVEPEQVTSILNSGVENSLEYQKRNNLRTQTALIGIDSYNNKDIRNAPFIEKRKILELISRIHPEFVLPEIAKTTDEKKSLYQNILKRKHHQTKEGIVINRKDSPVYKRFKFFKEFDVIPREIYKEESLKDRGPLAAGFKYSWTPKGEIIGSIGTGFNHKLKRDMYLNPEKYIGRTARVRAQKISPNLALIKPSFIDWHIDKNIDEVAAGIPKERTINSIPVVKAPENWSYVVQKHLAEKAGKHFDLRLGDSYGQGHSWAVPKGLPKGTELRLAIQQPTHTLDYFGKEGIIPSGYGKGVVEIDQIGKAKIFYAEDDKIKFSINEGKDTYVMFRPKDDVNWLIKKKILEKAAADNKKSLKLPEMKEGDTLLGGRFKNIKMKLEGIGKDKKNQPTIKTDKGERKALTFRMEKLMPKKSSLSNKAASEKKKIEQLAALEHEQWMSWSKSVEPVSDKQERKWERNWKPYADLPEKEKDKDRIWAKKVLKITEKKAGGPGSGNPDDNWHYITAFFAGIAISPLMSIGKRKKFMKSHKPLKKGEKIKVKDIKYVSQHKFVKKKLKKFRDNPDLLKIPIDVLKDRDGNLHIMDGHHRFLAALENDKRFLYANIYDGSKLSENTLLNKSAAIKDYLLAATLAATLAKPAPAETLAKSLSEAFVQSPIIKQLKKMLPKMKLQEGKINIPLNDVASFNIIPKGRGAEAGLKFKLD
ncbi:MAG: DNA polymerase ligase N-terminal domain-containing protein [Candidatus Heimdallarchaeaceae archaeon]